MGISKKGKKMGISKEGKETNKLFCQITGFTEPPGNHPQGDAWDIVNQQTIAWAEIKKGTYNQVRPYKYNTLVGYDTDEKQWYVIPPDVVISSFCYDKKGQHTTDPVEVLNLGEVKSKKFKDYKVSVENLRDAVIKAHLQGEKNLLVKEYAEKRREEYENTPSIRKKEIQLLKEKINA